MGEFRTATWDTWAQHLGTVDSAFGENGHFSSTNMWVNNRGLLASTTKPFSQTPNDGSTLISFGTTAQTVPLGGGFGAIATGKFYNLTTTSINPQWVVGGATSGAGSMGDAGVGGHYNRFGAGAVTVVTGGVGVIFSDYGAASSAVTLSIPGPIQILSLVRHRERLYASTNSDRVFYGALNSVAALTGTSYFDINGGNYIHSLVSTSAGLLMFGSSAIWILRGDPQGGDFRMLANIGTLPYASACGEEVFAMSPEGDPIVVSSQGAVSRPAPQFRWRPLVKPFLSNPFITNSWWQIAGASNGANVFMVCANGSRSGPNQWPGSGGHPSSQSIALIRKNGVWVPFTLDRIANGIAFAEDMGAIGAYDVLRARFEYFSVEDYPDDLTGPPLAGSVILPYIKHNGARLVPRQIRAYVWHMPGMGQPALRGACIVDYRSTNDDVASAASHTDAATVALQTRTGPPDVTITAPQRKCYTWNLGGAGWGRALRVQFSSIINCAFERVDLDYEVQRPIP